ncbi:MAG TPA: hypothetical protein VKB71_02710 [Rhizomicrobium sp.]|nr:hypothetical protein [Rhizomicrobium sp.]
MNLQHRRHPRSLGTDFVPPARLCIEPHTRKPVHVIIGVSAKGNVRITADLIGEWLAERFGRPFVPSPAEAESGLAAAAFYDELAYHFGNGAFIAAIGLARENRSGTACAAHSDHSAQAELFDAIAQTKPITLKFQGRAHAFFNRRSGSAQVTFDRLPGALEFVGRPADTSSRTGRPARAEEASAWCGFGTTDGSHADIFGRLSNAISHGVVDAELKTRLAEYV